MGLKKFVVFSLISFIVFLVVSCATDIPDSAGAWLVKVGPAGNEFDQGPSAPVVRRKDDRPLRLTIAGTTKLKDPGKIPLEVPEGMEVQLDIP